MKKLNLPFALGALLCLSLIARADELDDELAAGRALLVQGKEVEAEEKFLALMTKARAAATANPQDTHAQYILGSVAMYLGEDAVAQRALDLALRLEPKNARYAIARAQFATLQDKPAEAALFLRRLVTEQPDHQEAWGLLGEAQLKARDFAGAQASFQKLNELAPREARPFRQLAQVFEAQKKTDDALAAYQKAAALDPKDALAFIGMGDIEQTRGNLDKALGHFTQAAAIEPSDFRILSRQVQIYEAQGKIPERNAARDAVLALHKAGKVSANAFCREQFKQGNSLVIVLEYFELKGSMATRYAFHVMSADGKVEQRRLALSSYPIATAAALARGAIKGDERMFHLDLHVGDIRTIVGYLPAKEPTYEEARTMVKDFLDGKLKPAAQ